MTPQSQFDINPATPESQCTARMGAGARPRSLRLLSYHRSRGQRIDPFSAGHPYRQQEELNVRYKRLKEHGGVRFIPPPLARAPRSLVKVQLLGQRKDRTKFQAVRNLL